MKFSLSAHNQDGRRLVATGLVVAGLLATSGCMVTSQEQAAGTGADAALPVIATSTAGSSAKRTSGPLPKQPAWVNTTKPKDPLAPKAYKAVIRPPKHKKPTASLNAAPKTFAEPVAYSDGITLAVTKVKQGKMTGQGPGVFPGRPTSTFFVTLTNGTRKSMTLSVVVATVTYGRPARLAHAIYDSSSRDFSGTIKPGKTATAVYGFSVPPTDLSNVTLTLDFDGTHEAAVFIGPVK